PPQPVCSYTSVTQLHALSLHDALPIFLCSRGEKLDRCNEEKQEIIFRMEKKGEVKIMFNSSVKQIEEDHLLLKTQTGEQKKVVLDRKSTRLNSSHRTISYAVFCLKEKR